MFFDSHNQRVVSKSCYVKVLAKEDFRLFKYTFKNVTKDRTYKTPPFVVYASVHLSSLVSILRHDRVDRVQICGIILLVE